MTFILSNWLQKQNLHKTTLMILLFIKAHDYSQSIKMMIGQSNKQVSNNIFELE